MDGIRRASRRFSQRSKPAFGVNYSPRVHEVAAAAIAYLETYGMKEEGLFRVPGSVPVVQQMRKEINRGDKELFTSEDGVHEVASLLKLLYRELSEPLMTFDLYDVFIAAQVTNGTPKNRRDRILAAVRLLPEENFNGLKLLLKFLVRVSRFSKYNKMEPTNLAIVFAPSLLRSKEDGMEIITDAVVATALFVNLIEDFAYFFAVKQEAKALFDYTAHDDNEVSLTKGQHLFILSPPDEDGEHAEWVKVETSANTIGYVPAKFITTNLLAVLSDSSVEPPNETYNEHVRQTATKVKGLMEQRYAEIYSNLDTRERAYSNLQTFRKQMEDKYSTFKHMAKKKLEEEKVKFETAKVAKFKKMMESRYGKPPGQSVESDAENQRIGEDFRSILLARMEKLKSGEMSITEVVKITELSEDDFINKSIQMAALNKSSEDVSHTIGAAVSNMSLKGPEDDSEAYDGIEGKKTRV